jgi:hypothetical protein
VQNTLELIDGAGCAHQPAPVFSGVPMTITLVAGERFYYDGRNVEKGAEFDVHPDDVTLLTWYQTPKAALVDTGGGAPDWVPINAKIHIDFVGGSPQGRAWSNGAEVAIDTLLGSDPNTESGWSATGYDPGKLTTDGYTFPQFSDLPLGFIGAARSQILADATLVITRKNTTALPNSSFVVMSADGSNAVEMDLVIPAVEETTGDALVRSWGGSLSQTFADVVDTSTDAMNKVALTLTGSRIDLAVSGSTASTNVLAADDRPPGALVAVMLDSPSCTIQSITIYDPLPTTSGLSELSAVT